MNSYVFQKELPAALKRAENLPSLPAVALEVLRISQDEDTTLDDMANCLARDPALAAKLLKLANSSLFGVGKEVTTLQRATMLLGMKTVKLMALSFSLAGSLPKRGSQGSFDFAEYWHRSLVCAIAARALASLVKSPQGDEAFLCGLLAHFGKLVLTRCLPEEYEKVLAEIDGWPTIEQEEQRLGFSSADVCATLLESWELPPLIYVSVGYGPRPAEHARLVDPVQRQLAELLGLAHLAEAVLCNSEKGEALTRLHQECARLHGLGQGEVDALLVGLEFGIRETAEMLALQLPASISHAEVINQARMQMVQVSLGTAVDLAAAQRRNEALENEKRTLQARATTDKLTGLPNRAAFDAFLEEQVAARVGTPSNRGLGLLMIDVDHFKRFNDTHGHHVGDEVLRMVGGLMGRLTRKGDLSARYGGEEFALIVPASTTYGLHSIADRLREAIAQEALEIEGQRLSVTVSIGGACIAQFTSTAETQALIKLADHFLYRAKKAGRNRCEVYGKMEFPPRT